MARERPAKEQAQKIIDRIIKTARSAQDAETKKMVQIGQYVRQTIRRSFRKGSISKTKKGKPLGLFTPEGERIADMETWLKGAYVASGAGSFQKEKVQTRVKGGGTFKGSAPPGTLRLDHQKPGEFYTKGTGKFHDEERENIRAMKTRDRDKSRIIRQIRQLQTERKRQEKLSQRATLGAARKEAAARKAAEIREKQRELGQKHNALRQLKRNKRNRIVAPNKHYVPAKDVLPYLPYKNRSKPGQPPKSWPPHLFRKQVFFEATKKGVKIFMNPNSTGDKVLQNLEYGARGLKKRVFRIGEGHYKTVGELIGYTVESRSAGSDTRRYSHVRYALKRRYSKEIPQITVAPRPFWKPAKERLNEKLPEIFGEVSRALNQLSFGY